ncbi:iron ABC transporter permease [Heyndrickxia shackletonii]|uniref:Iron ABC transporter permease n=1 Tax=Heyndrickxia shackletonii TaxID=157838 RepID=A0A0Q3TBG0_9BACI|nr:iron chelate uptake ABC transporter family permease subunit [Heyndrickxia shackletonii]KQL51422.1 iron ABC transporter permease [Heyndrickxia shackletonii]NEZ00768.1 iron chelate uptake ABC transporter family permease subunit [Heyndrickxia shackletonii]
MRNKIKLTILAAITIALILIFLFTDIGNYWEYVVPRRAIKILAIILTGASIAFSTVVFQTITNNRILTPSIIGLDSLYMLIQTFLIFVFGATSGIVMNKNLNFLICVVLMILFAGLLYKFLFKKEGKNIYFLLLVGLVMGTLFQSFSSFMQVIIDPNDYMVIQDRMFASFNNINTDLLTLSIVLIAIISIYFVKFIKYLDVLSLGREEAINLGVDYDYVVKRLLIIVAILISISTALVGPITFLGLLVANVSYQFLNTYRHSYLITGAVFISIIALVGGLLIVERVFTFSTTLSVIINFIGGVYFIYLLLRGSKA